MKQLFRDYEVEQNRLVQLIFSITFALSCTMFELIIMEIVGVLSPGCVIVIVCGMSIREQKRLQFEAFLLAYLAHCHALRIDRPYTSVQFAFRARQFKNK